MITTAGVNIYTFVSSRCRIILSIILIQLLCYSCRYCHAGARQQQQQQQQPKCLNRFCRRHTMTFIHQGTKGNQNRQEQLMTTLFESSRGIVSLSSSSSLYYSYSPLLSIYRPSVKRRRSRPNPSIVPFLHDSTWGLFLSSSSATTPYSDKDNMELIASATLPTDSSYSSSEVVDDDDDENFNFDCTIISDDDDDESNNNNDDSDFLDDEMAAYLRFAGVGRLYADSSSSSSSSTSFDDNLVSNTATVDTSTTTTASIAKQQPTDTKRNTVDTVLERLQNAIVVVVGLGGVGSWTAEALCRSGIGTLVLIDCDDICISNTNRQLHTTISTIGQYKIDTMKVRLQQINPNCTVHLIHDFVSGENINEIMQSIQDLVGQDRTITALVDAIDSSVDKAALLAGAKSLPVASTVVSGTCDDIMSTSINNKNIMKNSIPVIVSVGGGAGLKDPTQIVSSDITDVVNDKLLRTTRKIMRAEYNFPSGQSYIDRKRNNTTRPWYIDCVYSLENPDSVKNGSNNNNNDIDSFRICDGQLGTACYVTGTLGFVAAGRVIDSIAQNDYS